MSPVAWMRRRTASEVSVTVTASLADGGPGARSSGAPPGSPRLLSGDTRAMASSSAPAARDRWQATSVTSGSVSALCALRRATIRLWRTMRGPQRLDFALQAQCALFRGALVRAVRGRTSRQPQLYTTRRLNASLSPSTRVVNEDSRRQRVSTAPRLERTGEPLDHLGIDRYVDRRNRGCRAIRLVLVSRVEARSSPAGHSVVARWIAVVGWRRRQADHYGDHRCHASSQGSCLGGLRGGRSPDWSSPASRASDYRRIGCLTLGTAGDGRAYAVGSATHCTGPR